MRKYFSHFFIAFFGLLTFFFLAQLVVSTIPSAALDRSIGHSLETLKSEGTYPSTGLPFRRIVLDNFTDPLMLNIAYAGSESSLLEKAFLNTWSLEVSGGMNQIRNLESAYLGTSQATASYERYWHGYLIFLRPLLMVFSYDGIRVMISFVLFISFFALLYRIWKKVSPVRAVAVLVAAVGVDFFFLGQSMQFSQVFLIGIFSGLWYLRSGERKTPPYLLFFVTGALTSFFDLLTAPLVTLGFLLIVATDVSKRREIVLNIISWTLGYLLLWASKWLMLEFMFDNGSITDALGHVLNRTVTQADAQFSYFRVLQLNIQQLIGYDRTNKYFVLLVAIVMGSILGFFRKINKVTLSRAAVWGGLALLPYIWYVLAANHSYLHVWYTYRAQFLSLAAGILLYSEVIDTKRINSRLKSFFKRHKN